MTRRSWFTATPRHEQHRFGEGAPDRFEAPKASINFSSNGTCVYGLPKRPCLRVLRPEFEARTARANADAEGQHCQRPGGRRHAAQRDYVLHMDAEARGDRSFDHTALRGARKCQRNARASRARGESPDSPLRHAWGVDAAQQRPATAPAAGAAASAPFLGGTGRIFTPAGLITATSLDIGRPASPAADGLPHGRRHVAHARFEAGHNSGAALHSGRRHHDASRPATATTAEAELLRQWPHGLPGKELRAASAQGLNPAPLGFGIGINACRIPAIMTCP